MSTTRGHRAENQDSVAWFYRGSGGFTEEHSEGVLFSGRPGAPFFLGGVCDGMGGMGDGKLASRIILTRMMEWGAGAEYGSLRDYVKAFGEELCAAEEKLMELLFDSGTTISMVMGAPDGWVSLHVGDSRTYVCKGGRQVFRTVDHSYVEDLYRHGGIEEEEMNTHPLCGRLSAYIGGFHARKLVRDDLKSWDSITVCSDGAFGYMGPQEFGSLVSGGRGAEHIAGRAYDAGSEDNISVLSIERVRQEIPFHAP